MSSDEMIAYRKYPGWNTRYVHYAMSKGQIPQGQIEIDRKEWPGGSMTGFISWIQEMNNSFADEKGIARDNAILWNPGEFDKWLQEKFPIQ